MTMLLVRRRSPKNVIEVAKDLTPFLGVIVMPKVVHQNLFQSLFLVFLQKYAKFVQTSFSESSYNMLKATDAASLADSIIEL